jgi:hypothetical protein
VICLENRELFVITLGFIILGIGMALLSLGEDTTFFIFPFFFAGDLAPIFMIVTLFIIMIFCWKINSSWNSDARFTNFQGQKQHYIRIGSLCHVCGTPLPENAAFCSSCGASVRNEFRGGESF